VSCLQNRGLEGETGTGKELVANAIHQSSRRRNGPFLSLNMGTIPASREEMRALGQEDRLSRDESEGGLWLPVSIVARLARHPMAGQCAAAPQCGAGARDEPRK
jgi:hypothetical protein